MESSWLSENLAEAVRTDDNFAIKCPDIATDVLKKKLKLVTLVEKLGNILTDTDPCIRNRGTVILAEVINNLPKDFLTEAELNYLSAFFIDRLKDHHSVQPAALKGIFATIQMEHTPQDIAVRVIRTFHDHIQCQTLKPQDRRYVYNIFRSFFYNFTNDLKSLGADFVYGFMSAIDQEKDARNLVAVFEMLPFFIKTFPLGHLTEEMFEIISCYFPVDYRPEYSDCPVTREELAGGLQKCLVASSDFAEFCIPLLIEKLDSKLKLAKMDSFKALIAGCEVFSIEHIRTYLLDLWRIIQHEVLPGSDKDIRELGLDTLKAIVRKMSQGASERQDPKVLTNVTTFVLNAGISSLNEVELNLFLPAVRMMLTVAEASPAACQEVCKKVLPILMKQYFRENGTQQKVTVLRALSSFVAVYEAQEGSSFYNSDLNSSWQGLPNLLLGAAQFDDTEVRKEGFHGLAVAGRLLDSSSRDILYDLLKKNMEEEKDIIVRAEMLLCLKEISRIHTEEVTAKIVKVKLKDIYSWPDDNGTVQLQLVLESLCEIADIEPFTSLIVPCMLQLITDSFSLEKCNIGIKSLRKLLESCGESSIYKYMYVQCNVVSRLTSWWLKGIAEEKCTTIFGNEEVLCNTAKILNIIVRNQELGAQTEVVTLITPQIVNANQNFSNGLKFVPLYFKSPQNHSVIIVLLEALIGSIHKDIQIPDLHRLVVDLTQLAIYSSYALTQLSACRLSANLINKSQDDEDLLKLLQEISEKTEATIFENTSSDIEKQNSTKVLVWITKSLVMRGHQEGNVWVEKLISLMAQPVVGEIVAEGFSLIMKEDVEYLNSGSFCNIRILYRQRFFSFCPKLIEAFHNAPLDLKTNYLIALSHMLQGVPQEVLLMNFEKMVPLLVESLQQTQAVLLSTTLDTLHSILSNPDKILKDHLQTFIPRLLALTVFQNSMSVRIKALQCVHEICTYPTALILPFKNNVLKVLGECLDDHKRLVRKEAATARSHWFLVGTKSKLRQY